MSAANRRLSALFVNHNSGAWCMRAVESLQLEWRRAGREEADLECIVFDSGSREGESTWWRSMRQLGARVVTSDENVGYATGLNSAFERSSGRPDDVVALLNPDVYFLPGSLAPLLERLDVEDGAAMVAPRCFVDEARELRLPPNELPSASRELADFIAARVPGFGRRLADQRSRRSRGWWGSEEPQRAEMLSGACLFLKRSVVEELGAPMDAAFPLYFEDADLCVRLARSGHELELVPESEVLHHWSRSAGPDFAGEIAARWAQSRERYETLNNTSLRQRCARRLLGWIERGFGMRPVKPIHELLDLGDAVEAPLFELERSGQYQLEVSLTSHFGLSAGVLFEGERYRLPARTWSWLFPGTYYARVVDARSGEVQRAWCFHKTAAARSWPLDPESLPQPRVAPRPAGRPGYGERVG